MYHNQEGISMKHISINNDFGTVELHPAMVAAIKLIQEAAWTLQMTPGEYMSYFEDGIPECPYCKDNFTE
jgi:hypothetical protein